MPRPTNPTTRTAAPPDQVLHFLQTVWQMEHALERASKRMEDAIGISGPQRFALRMIGERPGLTPRDLASLLHLHPSTITGIVQRLENRGFVRREANLADGRVAHLHLTRSGVRANTPSARGTVEHAARATLRGCNPRQRKAAGEVIEHFTRELMKI
jgi:DNA-binding MarR family transcriptional regulator